MTEPLAEELASLKKRLAEVEVALQQATSSSCKQQQGSAPATGSASAGSEDQENTGQNGHAEQAGQPASVPRPVSSEPVSMEATRVVMHQLVPLPETDMLGICTGGQVLSWIDVAAGLSAKSLARGACVTASVDAVHFLKPCRTGMVVIIAAMVNRSFATSMEVGVRVEAEDMRSGARHHCCSAYLTFVSLDARKPHGRPLPRVVATTREHAAIHEDAEGRRTARLAHREQLRQDPEQAEAAARCRLQPVTHRTGCPTLPPPLRLQDGHAPRQVEPALTLVYMTQAIMPHHANTLGITFGGQVMRWMEQCAYISASRLRGGNFLTASLDSLAFLRPTKVGHILYLTAAVTAVFGSSLEVMISVFGEDPALDPGAGPEAAVFPCADAYATIVTVDDEGRPAPLPVELVPGSEEERLRWKGAVARRAERLAMRRSLSRHWAKRPSLDGSSQGARSHPVAEEEAGAGRGLPRVPSIVIDDGPVPGLAPLRPGR